MSPMCTGRSRRFSSARMVYRLSCRRRVMRTLRAVSSYTWLVWGRWRLTVNLPASFFAVGGVGDDVGGRPFVVGGFFCRVQVEWGSEQFWRRGACLGISLAALLWFQPGIVGSRSPGPPLGRLLL